MLTLFYFTVLALMVLTFVFQVLVPLFKGTPLFPIFRKKTALEAEVDAKYRDVGALREKVALKSELKSLKDEERSLK